MAIWSSPKIIIKKSHAHTPTQTTIMILTAFWWQWLLGGFMMVEPDGYNTLNGIWNADMSSIVLCCLTVRVVVAFWLLVGEEDADVNSLSSRSFSEVFTTCRFSFGKNLAYAHLPNFIWTLHLAWKIKKFARIHTLGHWVFKEWAEKVVFATCSCNDLRCPQPACLTNLNSKL